MQRLGANSAAQAFGPQTDTFNLSPLSRDIESSLARLEDIVMASEPEKERELFNKCAVKALNSHHDGEFKPLKGREEQTAKQISNLARQRQKQLNDGEIHGRRYGIFSKALEQKFSSMSSTDAQNLIPSINRKLFSDNLRAAYVPESGEIWLGSRTRPDQGYCLSTILRRGKATKVLEPAK